MQHSTYQSILSTTAALWFQPDGKRSEPTHRCAAETAAPSAGRATADDPAREAALSAIDLLPWRDDLTDQDKRKVRELLRAQSAA